MRFLILLFPILSFAQVSYDITPREVRQHETIKFTIRVEGKTQSGRAPTFSMRSGDFDFVGRSTFTSINQTGSTVTEVIAYTYSFRPKKVGTLTFPAQEITYNGKTFQTAATTIKVTEAYSPPPGVSSIPRPTDRQQSRRGS